MSRAAARRLVHRALFGFWQALDDYPLLPYLISGIALLISFLP